MIVYKNRLTGERVECQEFNIRQGWLNNPRQIKDDFYFMKLGFKDVESDIISKFVYERLLRNAILVKSKSQYHELSAENYNINIRYMMQLSELTKRFNLAIERRDRIALFRKV